MKVVDVDLKDRSEDLVEKLLVVWESSVRATHLFLSDNEISEIKKYVPQALKEIPRLILLKNDRNTLVGFMGIVDSHLEMLFIAPKERGRGFGRKLLEYGITKYSINDLAVNEQNPRARGFYEYMGFEVYKRTEFDEQGNPYPLLYMKRG